MHTWWGGTVCGAVAVLSLAAATSAPDRASAANPSAPVQGFSAEMFTADTGGAVVDVTLDVRTTDAQAIVSVSPSGASLPFDAGNRVKADLASTLSARAERLVRGWGSMSACCTTRYRVRLRFLPPGWKSSMPTRLVGIEPYAPPARVTGTRRVLVTGRIDVNGRVSDVAFEKGDGLEDLLRSAVAQWRYHPLAAPARLATILVVEPGG
jgi:hypothetical protein